MVFIPADNGSVILFCLFALIMMGLLFYAVQNTKYQVKKFTILFLTYLIVFSIVVGSGLALKFVIPIFPILFLSVILGALFIALSNYGSMIAQRYSLAALIGFQAFRLPLELILHHWAQIGTVPETMTWTGQNMDIFAGALSLISIPIVRKFRIAGWLVQSLGFLLLMNVIRVVILSSPFPFSWPLQNPIQLIGYMPYALIGPLFVGPALAGHVIVFRKLLGRI